ncbi:hypothetical protein PRIPAC_75362, partial [Pristionchus pacificus]
FSLTMRFILLLSTLFALSIACDIIVHLKSKTDKKFEGLITASNGKKSEKFGFTKKGERLTFQQKADECGLKPWNVQTFENGKEISNVVVTLDGIGRVSYEVGDDLKPIPKDRQGAICKGDANVCPPLA